MMGRARPQLPKGKLSPPKKAKPFEVPPGGRKYLMKRG